LLLQCLGEMRPRLGELTGARFEFLSQIASVRLEFPYQCRLGIT
jgi:hypothetical protein